MLLGFVIVTNGAESMTDNALYSRFQFEYPTPGDVVKNRYWYSFYYFIYVICRAGRDTDIANFPLRRFWKNFCFIFATVLVGVVWPIHVVCVKLWGQDQENK